MSEDPDNPTPVSLLRQLQLPQSAQTNRAWSRFVNLYTPLLLLWARTLRATPEDAADLVQDVFKVLAEKMPTFQYDPSRRFRGWLWTIAMNKRRDQLARQATGPEHVPLDQLDTIAIPDPIEEISEEEYRSFLIARAMEVMRAELPEPDWRVCWEYLIQGRPGEEVAKEFGLTVNQVYLAKSRITRRLREALREFLD